MILILFRVMIAMVLIFPTLALTVIIWFFGGWIKGWDYMPNPVYALIGWVQS
jgi:hypothetical protein